MKKQNAFSLAEILISIGILGALFLILVPMMSRFTPKQDVVLIRKAYNVASNVIYEMINDTEEYPDYDLGFGYINDSIEKTATPKRFCDNFADKINTLEYEFNSTSKTCYAVTPDSIEWSIVPKFYNGSTLLKNYDTEITVQVPKGEPFKIYVNYDGKIKVTNLEVIAILKDPSKIK